MAAIVELKNICKSYDKGKKTVFKNLNFSIEEKDFMILFGSPGCGKSVLLRLIMGLEFPTEGQLFLRGEDASMIGAGARNIGYVPQSFALFPYLSVYKNIAYPLTLQKKSKEFIDAEVHRVAKMLSIENLLGKKPDQTSGGEKQRIAIARGIIKHTDLYIFDDPLVGLDFKLREQLVYDLRELQERLNTTFIYTTSDSSEALQLAKHIAVLNDTSIIETGDSFSIYYTPACADSMRILGFPNANILNGSIRNGTLKMKVFDVPGTGKREGDVIVGIRPESFKLGIGEANQDRIGFHAKVTLSEDLGGEEILYFDVNGETLIMMVWHHEEQKTFDLGSMIDISIDKKEIVYFDAATKGRL